MIRFIPIIATLFSLTLFAQNYQVGPSDLIRVTIVELEDVTGEYRIDNQGNLNLPYLGQVSVSDQTITQIRDHLASEFGKDLVNNPQVFVDLVEVNWRPINVIGAVNTPGKLQKVYQNITLVDAITHAGGLQEKAGDTILIMRATPDGITETLKVSYEELLIEGKSFLNIPIYAGDTINIPIDKPIRISVLGEVSRPDEYEFSSKTKVSLLRVIASAGGFSDFAKRNKVVVRRNGEEIKVDVRAIMEDGAKDFMMEDGDIVAVP